LYAWHGRTSEVGTLLKNQRRNDDSSWLQRQEASRRRAVGEADEEEEEEQGRSRGWPRAAAATPHVGLRNAKSYTSE
jgi:hypothetical protein